MFKKRDFLASTIAFIVSFIAMAPAHAVTSEDVMNRMNDEERSAFIAWAIEMAALMFHLQGDREKASCIMEWFFENGDGPQQVVQALIHFSDRPSHPVMLTLINRTCGEATNR